MKQLEITVIKKKSSMNQVEQEIINSVNGYLLRNRGAVSDFNLIKDIVDRNIDTADEEINTMLPIPLYLGLAGTMLGILIGLFFLPSVSDGNFEDSIDVLIGGVKIAMIAGFVGLSLTVINSGYFYKRAKTRSEKRKNDFYTFIQTELLPVVSQNLAGSIFSLQNNLTNFNSTFADNILEFNQVLGGIKESFDSQVYLMKDLKEMDVIQMSKMNVNVLGELRTSVREFEKFNSYLGQLNSFVDNAQKLNLNLTNQLDRTHEIKLIASELKTSIGTNKDLMTFLRAELNEVDERKQVVSDAVIDVDNSITKALDKLKEHIEKQMEAIRDITIKEEDSIEKLLGGGRGNLDELKKLTSMNDGLSRLESAVNKQSQSVGDLVTALKKGQNRNNDQLIPGMNPFELPNYIKYGALACLGLGGLYFLIKISGIIWRML